MKIPLSVSVLFLPLFLSGCAKEQNLVGHWRVVSGHDCQTQCSFNVLPVYNPEKGYHILFDNPEGKDYSGRIVDKGWGNYRILSHNGDVPLKLTNGKFYHPWGWVFEKDKPTDAEIAKEKNRPRCFWQWGR